MRVVADVGIVGLPNAGKSSLLAALTRAAPEVAAYPFTTLMPNLGVLRAGGDLELGLGVTEAVLADMPGIIQGQASHQILCGVIAAVTMILSNQFGASSMQANKGKGLHGQQEEPLLSISEFRFELFIF